MSVIEDIKKTNLDKLKAAAGVFNELRDYLLKEAEHATVNEVLDIVMAVTGYDAANVPGGEAHTTGRTLAKLVEYMSLRAKQLQDPNSSQGNEPLELIVRELVLDSARLYAEFQDNLRSRA